MQHRPKEGAAVFEAATKPVGHLATDIIHAIRLPNIAMFGEQSALIRHRVKRMYVRERVPPIQIPGRSRQPGIRSIILHKCYGLELLRRVVARRPTKSGS